uniref:Uncharacterized protein n=1 Tax=Nelumbo nucifera TaxID=4432 RepID=A0A822YWN2_NELNU|nr:TPA_asm: hypothetical protein HUJ06_007571 [Nelumbo nucifera]
MYQLSDEISPIDAMFSGQQVPVDATVSSLHTEESGVELCMLSWP